MNLASLVLRIQPERRVAAEAALTALPGVECHAMSDDGKLIVTVDAHGNTSAASIPLALDAAVRDGRIRRGETLLLEGVGGGFTWGSVLLDF